MNNYSNEPINNLSLRKSNDFVTAKYKSSLLENKVMSIALSRIEVNNKDKEAPLEAKLYPGELKKLVSDESHIYRDLKKLSKTIIGHTMFLEDGKGNFKAFSIVPNAEYIDGVFTIKFNNELKEHILGLEKNYTTLELAVMTDFSRNTAFRLYEVLKKEIFKIPEKNYKAYTQVEYNISELRFIIGLANSDDQNVKNAMANMNKNIDWDSLFEKLDKKDKTYVEWRDLQRRILKPAQEELKEKSDIRFEYEGIKEGRTTKRILFTIYRNKPQNQTDIDRRKQLIEENKKNNRQLELPMDLYPQLYEDYVGHNNLEKEDIALLINKADGSEERVRKAIEMADKQDNIYNYIGWIIRCIENNYTQTETLYGSNEDATKMNGIIEDVKNNRESIAQKVWERIKNKDEFEEFMIELENIGLDLAQIETIYEYSELTQSFTDWKLGKGITLI